MGAGQKQEEFDKLVAAFNSDYLTLLHRAAVGDYDRLIEAFLDIKDLHDVIVTMHDIEDLELRTALLPITFRANSGLLAGMGFDETQVVAIEAFFDMFRAKVGRHFDEIGSER